MTTNDERVLTRVIRFHFSFFPSPINQLLFRRNAIDTAPNSSRLIGFVFLHCRQQETENYAKSNSSNRNDRKKSYLERKQSSEKLCEQTIKALNQA